MNRAKETAGKTAQGAATRKRKEAARALVMALMAAARKMAQGKRNSKRGTLRERLGRGKYAILAAMATALNSVSWAENDNTPDTPETMWKEFRLWNSSPAHWGFTLVETIGTGAEYMSAADEERRRELKAALKAHGVRVGLDFPKP